MYLRDLSPMSPAFEGRTVRIAVKDADENARIVAACRGVAGRSCGRRPPDGSRSDCDLHRGLAGALARWGAGPWAGLAVAASGRRELIVRWCAWAVGVPLVTVGPFWWGGPGTAAVAVVVGVIAVLEFG